MNYINFWSNAVIPITITLILLYAIKEKVKIFDTFLELLNSMYGIIIGNTKQ